MRDPIIDTSPFRCSYLSELDASSRSPGSLLPDLQDYASTEEGCFFVHTFEATKWATVLTVMSRRRSSLPPDCVSLRTFEFAIAATRLCAIGSIALTEHTTWNWQDWPVNPATQFGGCVGYSALEVSYQFAIDTFKCLLHSLIEVGKQWPEFDAENPLRILSLDIPVQPHPDDRIVAWKDAALRLIDDTTLPPAAEWPDWKIFIDAQTNECLLWDEWQTYLIERDADGAKSKRGRQPTPDADAKFLDEFERRNVDITNYAKAEGVHRTTASKRLKRARQARAEKSARGQVSTNGRPQP